MKKILFPLVLFFFWSCKQSSTANHQQAQNQKKNTQQKAVKVRIAIAKDTVFDKQIISNGRLLSRQTAQMHFRQNGYLQKIYVHNGSMVSKGKIIARLDNALLHNAVQQAQTQVAKARQKFEELKINYKASDSSQLKIKAGLSEAQARLREAQIKYNQSLLKAPFSGQIANLTLKPGNLVTPSDTIATLLDNKHLIVRFPVLESEMPFVKKGMSVVIQSFYDPSLQAHAVVNNINPSVNAGGMVWIEALLNRKNPAFINGMRVKVSLLNPVKNKIVIPKTALVLRNNKEVVFTYHKGLSQWHYVKLFGENETSYAVSEGLKAGDTLIVSNNMNLAHEARVKIVQ